MYKDKKILAIIPARGGSKGIPKKNIIDICGKPLIYYSIEFAKNSKYIDDFIVSTDNKDIKLISEKYGATVQDRPAEIASDETSMEEVLKYSVKKIEKENKIKYDYIVLLQPTSPIRLNTTFKKALKKMIDENLKTVLSVNVDNGFYWIKDNDNYKTLFKNQSRRRQERKKILEENSCIYIFEVKSLLSQGLIPKSNKDIGFIEISKKESVDINDEFDLIVAESLIRGI